MKTTFAIAVLASTVSAGYVERFGAGYSESLTGIVTALQSDMTDTSSSCYSAALLA